MENRSSAGFTIVELIVTITVLVILTTLVVVRLSSTQVGGRDQERESDITTLATALEVYYQNGSTTTGTPKGYYPGGQQVTNASNTNPPFKEFLDGVPLASYIAPDSTNGFGVNASAPTGTNSDGSFSDAQVRPLLNTTPYLYQPLTRANTYCSNYTACVKFNLYYLHEGNDAVVKVRSRNQ